MMLEENGTNQIGARKYLETIYWGVVLVWAGLVLVADSLESYHRPTMLTPGVGSSWGQGSLHSLRRSGVRPHRTGHPPRYGTMSGPGPC